MASKLKRGDLVEYHNGFLWRSLNGAIGVVRREMPKLYITGYYVTWIASPKELKDGFYGPGVLRKVADGES